MFVVVVVVAAGVGAESRSPRPKADNLTTKEHCLFSLSYHNHCVLALLLFKVSCSLQNLMPDQLVFKISQDSFINTRAVFKRVLSLFKKSLRQHTKVKNTNGKNCCSKNIYYTRSIILQNI